MPIYMKIEGIDGDVIDKGYEKSIEIQSFSWGASQNAAHGAGGGGGAGKVSVSDMSLMKALDKSSPELLLLCCTGNHLPAVQITFVREVGDGQSQAYLKYELKDVLVSSFQTSGSEGSGLPTEGLSLNFAEIRLEQKNRDGSSEGAFWNIRFNRGGLLPGR